MTNQLKSQDEPSFFKQMTIAIYFENLTKIIENCIHLRIFK